MHMPVGGDNPIKLYFYLYIAQDIVFLTYLQVPYNRDSESSLLSIPVCLSVCWKHFRTRFLCAFQRKMGAPISIKPFLYIFQLLKYFAIIAMKA